MGERLEVYDLKGKLLGVQDREEFYKEIKSEFKKNGKISRQVKRSLIFLMNSKGKIMIQKRNYSKKENPGLFDKTLGGHVEEGDSYATTAIKECAEELGFPVSILSDDEFERAVQRTDLRIVGIFRKLDYSNNFVSERMTHENLVFQQPYMQTIYIGYYDGPIQFIDGESIGVEMFTKKQLEIAIAKNPDMFTKDLVNLFDMYKHNFVPV